MAELSEINNDPPAREARVRGAVRLLSSALDELETVVKDSKHAVDAEYENEITEKTVKVHRGHIMQKNASEVFG